MMMGTINENVRNTKANESDDEIENGAKERAFTSSMTMASLVSIMR
jgi:hypothetical protein